MKELTEKQTANVTDGKSVESKDVNATENKVETKKEEVVKTELENKEEKEDEIKLTHLNKDFVYEVMSIPSHSSSEYRMLTYIVMWARRNGIDYEFDDYGNIYLTKGEIGNGEYYPCVTAHLDTVQSKQKLYAQAGQPLDIKTRIAKGKHEIYVDGMGIGGDDKAGVTIGLSMFSHFDVLKACFFLEEEIGCKGSEHLNTKWFENVGYVMGYDSPDLNRAAWACSGVKLFNKDFFQTHMQEICKKHGLTDFRSEPFTDVKIIREKTDIICMNFGTGYYNAHMQNEYCVLEDMDNACRMGVELIEHLGKNRYELKSKKAHGRVWDTDTYSYKSNDSDEEFFDSLSPRYSYSRSYGTYKGTTSETSKTTTTTTTKKEKDSVSFDTLKYMVETYESHIEGIKTAIENKCKELNISFDSFKDIFNNNITF